MSNNTSKFEDVINQNGVLAFTNKGVSMMPLLRQDRDVMVIKALNGRTLKKLDVVLFKRDNGQYILHRILKVQGDAYWIVGDNCFRGEMVRSDQILGILTDVIRDGKTISVDSPSFKFYSHLWCDCYPVRFFLLRLKTSLKYRLSKLYHIIKE